MGPTVGCLKTLFMVMCHITSNRSFTLKLLYKEKLPVFVLASRKLLRATLPKGELNTVVAKGVLAMKRTSLFVTGVPTVSPLLMAFRLISWVVANWQPTPKSLQASPAKIPTVFTGALGLPKNGRRFWSTVPANAA